MTEAEWLACTDLVRMLDFVRPQATLDKMAAFAAAFESLFPARLDDEPGQGRPSAFLSHPSNPAPIASAWGHDQLITAIEHEVFRQIGRRLSPDLRRKAMRDGCDQLRDIFAPFQSVILCPAWLVANDRAVLKLAAAIDVDWFFDLLPILADALEEAGCADDALLAHLRGPGPHVRGCWALDLILGKE